MQVTPEVFPGPLELGAAAAALVADGITAARSAGRPFLLGCPGGRSPLSTYRALARSVARDGIDLSGLVVVMMDDYLVPDPDDPARLVREDPAAGHSCLRFGREQIVGPLEAAAGPGRGLGPDALWIPDPADPAGYDARIADAGGIDVFLLASGAGDGHVAFNAPGSARSSTTRVVELPVTTRTDNLATFPSFGGDLDAVPRHGVTVGIATIVEQARRTVMLVHGADKARAAQRLVAADRYQPDWPATCLTENARPLLFLDAAAARPPDVG